MSNFIVNLSILVILGCVPLIHSQTLQRLGAVDPCVSKITCRECIQTQSCAWCMTPDFQDKPRCFHEGRSPRDCPEIDTYNPKNVEHFIEAISLTNRNNASSGGGAWGSGSSWTSSFNSSSSWSGAEHSASGSGMSGSGISSSSGKITQIYPQRISLSLRANEKHSLKIGYSQAQDYPVDLYYLMDLSKSMEDDKEKLGHLGDLLASTMKNITSNFRLGFGSFVDKVLMPYVSTVPKNLLEPCTQCAAPYGYHNVMALSEDTRRFAEEVKRAAVSGNLDAPEGGFDAIMQAVVCRNQIKWRDQARRLLVFSTDAGFHYAGDGKLGGVITPNDGLCHLDSNGLYTYSTIQDYPSISQINLKVKQNAINVIFAVTAQEHAVYQKLSNHVEGSSCAVLDEDSANVVQLVQEEYSKISSSVEMKDSSSSSVQIQYYSACLNGTKLLPTNKCDGLRVGDVVEFTAEILVTHCPLNPSEWQQQFQIYPVGINESLTVDLSILCDCPCEQKGIKQAKQCGFHGTYKCGICECDPQFFGRNCECSITDIGIDKNTGCRATNDTLVDCNGRGTCVCGICECEKRADTTELIRGQFCECDNFSCDRYNDVVCTGPQNGVCECGTCRCYDGWTGLACECRSTTDTCRTDNIKEICSGHGDCECGLCRCHATEEGRYSGQYCEKCPTCAGRCTELKDCVQCQMYQTGPLKGEDCLANCTFVPIEAETIVVDDEQDEHLCVFYDDDDCKYQFVYSDKEPGTLRVRAQKERECPPKVVVFGIVLAVIAAIVLIGLAILLLWKLLTTIHDRREFARFEKERMMAKWDTGENPIYKQATSTFKNPTYAGK